MRYIFNSLYYSILIIILILIVCFICIICTACKNGYYLCLDKEGIDTCLMFWRNYTDLIKALGYSVTLWIACYNLKRFIDIETVKALGDLRTKLNDDKKKEIHTFLFQSEDKTPILKSEDKSNSSDTIPQFANADIFDYIGTIELGAIMVKRGAITLDEFKNQFGYRVENIKNNSELMNHIKKYKKYYSNFLYLERKIQGK